VGRGGEYTFTSILACEQAPGGASAEKTFGMKRPAIGARTNSPKSPMSVSKIWMQSGNWWIIIIHDLVLVFSSNIQNLKWQKRGKKFFKRLPRIYQVI